MEVIEEKVAKGGEDSPKARKAGPEKASSEMDVVSFLRQSIQEHRSHRSSKAAKPQPQRKTE